MKNKSYQIVLSLIFICIPNYVFGAEFILSGNKAVFYTTDEFNVDLILNTNNENINAIEGKIVFPRDLLELKEIREGGSIINFWIDKPYASSNQVLFSGIIPLGYNNNNGRVLSLIFKGKKDGEGYISIADTKLLSNDGVGTSVVSKSLNFEFSIDKNTKQSFENINISDFVSPETFKPEIVKYENIAFDKWLLLFSTDDKGSGIDSYEVREKKYKIFSLSKWIKTKSPYVLTDQALNSYIFVKAIDKQGNVRIIELVPKNPTPFYLNIEIYFVIILIELIYLAIHKKRRGKKH